MNDSDGLVQKLVEAAQQRMEGKVLERLASPEGAAAGIATLLDEVLAAEQSELSSRAEQARANGEDIQADMYDTMRNHLLPYIIEQLRGRLRQG